MNTKALAHRSVWDFCTVAIVGALASGPCLAESTTIQKDSMIATNAQPFAEIGIDVPSMYRGKAGRVAFDVKLSGDFQLGGQPSGVQCYSAVQNTAAGTLRVDSATYSGANQWHVQASWNGHPDADRVDDRLYVNCKLGDITLNKTSSAPSNDPISVQMETTVSPLFADGTVGWATLDIKGQKAYGSDVVSLRVRPDVGDYVNRTSGITFEFPSELFLKQDASTPFLRSMPAAGKDVAGAVLSWSATGDIEKSIRVTDNYGWTLSPHSGYIYNHDEYLIWWARGMATSVGEIKGELSLTVQIR